MEKTIARTKTIQGIGRGAVILRVILAALLFSVFRKIDSALGVGNILAGWPWSAVPVFLTMALIRLILTGTVVLAVLPPILGFKRPRNWLPEYLKINSKVVLLGGLSFLVFCMLAAAISLSLGILQLSLSAVFSRPDLGPDPDIVGWAYFLLALTPGIWEELAFRGLIQSKLRTRFPTTLSIVLSAVLFALFHFTSLLTQPPSQAIGGVIMALFFGIAWGVMTVRTGSVVPAMISHYLVDSLGQILLGIDSSSPALATGFFLLLTLTFPIANIVLVRVMYRKRA